MSDADDAHGGAPALSSLERRRRYVGLMADLNGVEWPPAPIHTERLLIRPTAAADLDGYVELLCSEQVRRYLGGPLNRDDLGDLPQIPGDRRGAFAVQADGHFIGIVTLDRRDPARPGHILPAGNELEVSYTFLPAYWGHGYATEAVAGVLGWASRALPGEPVVLSTQTANEASVRLAARLGFVETERFIEFTAEQWYGVRGT